MVFDEYLAGKIKCLQDAYSAVVSDMREARHFFEYGIPDFVGENKKDIVGLPLNTSLAPIWASFPEKVQYVFANAIKDYANIEPKYASGVSAFGEFFLGSVGIFITPFIIGPAGAAISLTAAVDGYERLKLAKSDYCGPELVASDARASGVGGGLLELAKNTKKIKLGDLKKTFFSD